MFAVCKLNKKTQLIKSNNKQRNDRCPFTPNPFESLNTTQTARKLSNKLYHCSVYLVCCILLFVPFSTFDFCNEFDGSNFVMSPVCIWSAVSLFPMKFHQIISNPFVALHAYCEDKLKLEWKLCFKPTFTNCIPIGPV